MGKCIDIYNMSNLSVQGRCTKRHPRDGTAGKVALNLDLNFPPVDCQPCERASGSRQPQTSRGARQPYRGAGHQHESSAPPSSLIDVELLEDEVVALSSSRGFPVGRNRSRRNRPVTVILDEDLETNLRRPVILVEEQEAMSSFITRNKLVKTSTSRTVINCDIYHDLEDEHDAKARKLSNSVSESVKAAAKKPTFTCPICLDELVEAASTICGHIFCLSCIETSIQTQKKCPTCRRKLTMKSFHRLYLPN